MRRWPLILALTLWGCGATTTPAVVPAVPVRVVPLGINAAWHGPLPPSDVTALCGTTIRTPQLSVEGLQSYYNSIVSCPSMRSIVVVEAPDIVLVHAVATMLRPGDAVEMGNELELAPSDLTLQQFTDFTTLACVPTAITGGVYTLNADTRARVLAAHTACPSARLGVHLYEPLTTADVAWLSALPAHVVVTETGYPTRCDPARVPEQQTYLERQQTLLSTIPTVDQMIVYQYPVGPSCNDLDTFGLGPAALAWFLHSR